ncbi:MAG: N-acetyltransferase [Clostridia bacterium]|nr:N-acetyltransferase [Clostridia bacterium]
MNSSEFILRPASPRDASEILSIYSPFILNTTVTFETEVPSEESFALRIENVTKTYPWVVCEHEGKIIGYAYSARHRERAAYGFSAELSVYVRPEYSGRGIGKLLCREIIDISEKLGVCTLFSAISVPNEKSIALHRSLGFSKCGHFERAGRKFDKWLDLAWYELFLSDDPPKSLRPVNIILSEQFGKTNQKTVML